MQTLRATSSEVPFHYPLRHTVMNLIVLLIIPLHTDHPMILRQPRDRSGINRGYPLTAVSCLSVP